MSNDTDLLVAFLKQLAESEESDIDPEAVEFEEENLRYYQRIKEACEYAGLDFDEVKQSNPQVASMMDRSRNLGTNKAVQEGDLTRLAGIKGIDGDNRIDATGYDKLIDLLKPAAQQVLVKGSKGSGKTIKNLTIGALAVQEGIVDKVMMNIKTKGLDPEIQDIEFPEGMDIRFAEKISTFLKFAKEDGDKLIIGDEWSTVANALGGHSDAQQIFPRIINALRKSVGGSTRLMYVGHNHDNDILPTLKHNADVVIYAEGKKEDGLIDKLSVYRSVGRESAWNRFKDGDTSFKMKNMEDIPRRSPWAVDTNYFAHLEFDLDNPKKQIQRGKLIDDWEQYQEDDGDGSEHPESPEEVLEELQDDSCIECGQPTYKGFEYCEPHLRKALSSGEFDDVLEDGEESGESDDDDDKGGFNGCRVCDRTIGISSDGFCPAHDEDDLD